MNSLTTRRDLLRAGLVAGAALSAEPCWRHVRSEPSSPSAAASSACAATIRPTSIPTRP
jgi:hypothetical protein